jgi:hypothetical protein
MRSTASRVVARGEWVLERFAYDGDDMALGWLARSGSMSYLTPYASSKTS